jgi:uncharacterized surface protein with fasciclin (FAS1) repeats
MKKSRLRKDDGEKKVRIDLIIFKETTMRNRIGRLVETAKKRPFLRFFWANLMEIPSFWRFFHAIAGLAGIPILAGIVILFSGLGSCKKAAPLAPVPLTPLQKLVNTDTTLSLYHRLILQSNETALLNDDSVTLLIPVNAAFRAAGYSADSIDNTGATQANNIVLYGFIPSPVIIPVADSGAYISYNTLLPGASVYGMSDGKQVLFNGVPAIRDTAATGKAIVYLLGVLAGSPPADTLGDLLAADTSLSFFAEAMLRTGLDSTLPAGNYTLLAPVNSAFMAAGYDSLGAIDSADSATLTQLLEYHFIKGLYFTNTLAAQTSLPTLLGSPVSVIFQNGLIQFSGGSNSMPANLLPGSRLSGSDILVYRIDEVLTP